MSELQAGTLKIKTKKNKKGNINTSFEFSYTTSDGQYRALDFTKIPKEQVSMALLEKIEQATSSFTLTVEFQTEGDRVLQLREQGTQWDREIPDTTPQAKSINKKERDRYFHNPYNFVPALPRPINDQELGDHKPIGHERYEKDYWSGRITVKLTTVTPLLIPDAAEMTEDNGHNTYPLRLGKDGKPYLPPTSIKGMLRSAYEAVTNSRLSVFYQHDQQLGYRTPARNTVKPARVEQREDGLYLRILEESSCVGGAAKLPRYQKNGRSPDKGEKKAGLRYSNPKQLPQHGDRVQVKLNQGKVTAIEPYNGEDYPTGDWKLGWVCITGANIKQKQNERVFIQRDRDSAVRVTKDIAELWENLIADYQKTHIKDLKERQRNGQSPSDYLGHDPGKTAWSRHVYDQNQLKLEEGILCYVQLKKGHNENNPEASDVLALQPVTISRRLYDQKPADLLPKSLHPAPSKKELSPADRVFGWVNQDGQGSYKGQLRVHSVECQTSTEKAIKPFENQGLPLAILGEPKPAQTRFYTAENKDGTPLHKECKKEYGYESKDRGLRGRKVYPHHDVLSDDYWNNSTESPEYRRPNDERDSQNKSIQGWVEPTTEFTFDIDLINLSSVELGALLWLLNLPEKAYHRLGGGKPFGFGSVRLKIENLDLGKGEDWDKFYRSLFPTSLGEINPEEIIDQYRQAVETAYGSSFEKVPFIAAFDRCAKGFEDGLPIHYPRLNQEIDSESKNYEWFEENEKGEKLSLPSLVSGESLPLKDEVSEASSSTPATSKALERSKPSSKK